MSAVLDGGYRSGHDDRTFHYAIAASLVLHALLLFAVPGWREKNVPDRPGVLVAHIVEPPRAALPRPEAARPPEPPKSHAEPRIEPRKPPPVHKPSPIAERPVEPAPPPSVAERAAPSAEPPPAAPAATGPVSSSELPPNALATADAVAGALGEYERQLRIVAGNYKRYPRVAVDNNWQGTAEVTMVVGANGIVKSITVKTSSGYKALDDQAVEMVRRAKPLIPIPPALRGQEFSVKLRAIYNLSDGG